MGLISRQKLKKERKIMERSLKERERMERSERKRKRCPTLVKCAKLSLPMTKCVQIYFEMSNNMIKSIMLRKRQFICAMIYVTEQIK